ncbi:carbohydrate ABC transporter permease [Paenibacillus sacheonensis]|uniref:ABC transporter permease subunit n=1 Tax=Paenibacillus sacheonensis TaxID=742054 RepID=A0A7X4YNM9_9BACL|nr:carbohydrate ABC transporter permease [Paenibacillus sacheonensis]MBM7565972.1 putative aldouronate transport system permease protein [Paenibacillus sacheonensis]NBC68714.1 ABC transporter permease subunit [Paenibacillus sacheonensis]
MQTAKKLSFTDVWINGFFILVSLSMVLPFLLVIAISVTQEQSLIADGYRLLPKHWSTDAYHYIFKSPTILIHAYGVTILTTIAGTLGSLALTSMTAYVVSRKDYRYVKGTTFYVFFTMLFSGGLVPSYILITQYLHLKDTIWALILPGMLSPFYVLIMKGFISEIPKELIESSKVDGASEWRIFFQMILPLAKPALATLGLFISFNYWNSWFPALLYINSENLVPIQLLLTRMMNTINFLTTSSQFMSGITIDTSKFPNLSARMALTVLAAGPMMFIFPFFQKYFVKGLTVGSLKG